MKQQTTTPTQPTLLFIPDISGFTQFVNETEITHSQHIIEELLEILIDANEMGLRISEIEGDAILFYREGTAPTAAELLAQVQRMYVRFHAHLKKYETRRICQCGACSTANSLSLKFIIHYGDIGKNQVREYIKLFGKDVIVAHRLMKNKIPHKEYVLLTHQLINACTTWVQIEQLAWAHPEKGTGNYDVGSIGYCSIILEPLRVHVPEPAIEDYSLPGATTKIMESQSIIEAPIDLVFNVVSDLSNRHLWMVSVKDSDQTNSKISQHGSTHRCVMKGDKSDPFFVSHNFEMSKERITFTDTDQREGICIVFTLRRVSDQLTRIEMHTFMKRNFFKEWMFNLFMKKKYLQKDKDSLNQLNGYCKKLVQEGKQHSSQILLEPVIV